MCVLLDCVAISLLFSGTVFGQQAQEPDSSAGTTHPTPLPERIQTAEAIALDDQLAREMDDYRRRFREFRHALRSKFPRGEDRIAAIEQWQKQHKGWREGWERRSKRLDEIWNWGPDGMPKAPKKVYDLTTPEGSVAAAIRNIRSQAKGTGKAAQRIQRWMKENKQLLDDAEEVRAVQPAPEDTRVISGTPEEAELIAARKALQETRNRLLLQGKEALKAAMQDPGSQYSRQKAMMGSKAQAVARKAQTEIKSKK